MFHALETVEWFAARILGLSACCNRPTACSAILTQWALAKMRCYQPIDYRPKYTASLSV